MVERGDSFSGRTAGDNDRLSTALGYCVPDIVAATARRSSSKAWLTLPSASNPVNFGYSLIALVVRLPRLPSTGPGLKFIASRSVWISLISFFPRDADDGGGVVGGSGARAARRCSMRRSR